MCSWCEACSVALLYFVILLKSRTFGRNQDDESSSAHVCHHIGQRFSNSTFQPLRSGLPLLLLPSSVKVVNSLHSAGTHTHSTPFQLPKPTSSRVDFRVLIRPHSPIILTEGSLTLITDVSRNPLESQVTPPNTSPLLCLNAPLTVIPLSLILLFSGVAKERG